MPTQKQKRDNISIQPKSVSELRKAYKHFRYEVAMLRYSGDVLTGPNPPRGLAHAMAMESFLIHARNLHDFFYGLEEAQKGNKRVRGDDVFVEHFFDGDGWHSPVENRLTGDEIDRVNKRLAHLTYSREDGRYEDWDFKGIHSRLLALVELFNIKVSFDKKVERNGLPGHYFYEEK